MNKIKQVDQILAKIKKEHPSLRIGIGLSTNYERIPTPFPSLNTLIGGGFPRSKFTTVCGAEQTGKGTSVLQTIAHNQAEDSDFIALWLDAEGAFEAQWAEQLGLDMDRIILLEYDSEYAKNAENLLQIALDLFEQKVIDMCVIDSISALLPKGEDEKDLEGSTMMETARLMGKFFRKAIRLIRPDGDFKGTACVLIGQVYNVPSHSNVTLTEVRGGNAVKHWAHLRLKTRRGNKDEFTSAPENITQPDGEVKKLSRGWAQHLKLEKTRCNDKEGQEVILQFFHGRGLDSTNSAITTLLAHLSLIHI